MSNKTIAKIGGLVILFACSLLVLSSCSRASSGGKYAVNPAELSTEYGEPVAVGRIESDEITESSGIASSPCQTDVLWTHNDSGDGAFIYAIDLTGKHLGTWRVANARNSDWEDLAAYKDTDGTCYLYIGEIGNNKGEREEQKIYRVREPVVSPETSSSNNKVPPQTEPADAIAFRYPEPVHDAETLMVQPRTGDIYVLTKRIDGPSTVFKIKAQFGSAQQAERVGELSLPAVPNGLLTGGAIAPDGKRVVVCDYAAGYELSLPQGAKFEDIWKQRPVPISLGDRKQGEAVTYSADGRSIIATSERRNSPVIVTTRK